jgi:rfaE bifunctional protein nucleotidyltransferase chain/domain
VEPFEWTPEGPQPLERLLARLAGRRAAGDRLVTTNGCFDLLHVGHLRFLEQARALGDLLVVALNGDESVRRLKGAGRPLLAQDERAALLAALRPVDHVVIFEQPTPNELLARLRPDLHCKAGDYTLEALPETEVVRRHGGQVRILPLAGGYSTTRLVERILATAQQTVERDQRADIVEQLLAGANVLRQTAYSLREQIVQAAARIAGALAAGGRVLIWGDEAGRALIGSVMTLGESDAHSADDDRTRMPCRPGDIVLLVSSGGASDEALIAEAHGQGAYVIELAGAWAAPGAADLSLRIPAADVTLARPAQVAVLQALRELVERMRAEGSSDG